MKRPNGPRCDYLKRAKITVFSPTRLIECFSPAALIRISRSRRASTGAFDFGKKSEIDIFASEIRFGAARAVWVCSRIYKVGCVLRFAFSIFLTSAARPQIAVNTPALEQSANVN